MNKVDDLVANVANEMERQGAPRNLTLADVRIAVQAGIDFQRKEMEKPKDPSFFCDKMDIWAKACMTQLETDGEITTQWRREFSDHWLWIRRTISKSNLLARLFYGGEELRTEQCPIHKGKWSGCTLVKDMECEGVCADGFNVTGWLRTPAVTEKKS